MGEEHAILEELLAQIRATEAADLSAGIPPEDPDQDGEVCPDEDDLQPETPPFPKLVEIYGLSFALAVKEIEDAYLRAYAEHRGDGVRRWQVRPKRLRPKCGAKTRRGTPCQAPPVWDPWLDQPLHGGKCKNHGGLSTGPRTPEGRQRISEANRRRAEAKRRQRMSVYDKLQARRKALGLPPIP